MDTDRQLKIETNIIINHMNHLENLIKKCLCDSKYKELEENIWNCIDKKDVKNLRKYRYDIEVEIDFLEAC